MWNSTTPSSPRSELWREVTQYCVGLVVVGKLFVQGTYILHLGPTSLWKYRESTGPQEFWTFTFLRTGWMGSWNAYGFLILTLKDFFVFVNLKHSFQRQPQNESPKRVKINWLVFPIVYLKFGDYTVFIYEGIWHTFASLPSFSVLVQDSLMACSVP